MLNVEGDFESERTSGILRACILHDSQIDDKMSYQMATSKPSFAKFVRSILRQFKFS